MIKQKADVGKSGMENVELSHEFFWRIVYLNGECLLCRFLAYLQIAFSDNLLEDIQQQKKGQNQQRRLWRMMSSSRKHVQGQIGGRNMGARARRWTSSARRGGWSTLSAPTSAGSASRSATTWATPPGAPTASSRRRWGSSRRGNFTLNLLLFFVLSLSLLLSSAWTVNSKSVNGSKC